MEKKRAIAIGAIETVRDAQGHVKKLSVTFLNNANTWAKDHPEFDTRVLDCRAFKDLPSPMKGLWDELAKEPLDALFISSHSDWEGLYIFSKIRRELAEEDRYFVLGNDWAGVKFNPGAYIVLSGCQAGGRDGVRLDDSIAATIANKTGVSVWAFLTKSSQKKRPDGGYEQKPDRGRLVEFVPERVKL